MCIKECYSIRFYILFQWGKQKIATRRHVRPAEEDLANGDGGEFDILIFERKIIGFCMLVDVPD
jgi:hypothetical protein